MRVSIVVRTLNEERYLARLLQAVQVQRTSTLEIETVVIDSGSTDKTVPIARSFGCVLTSILREEFSFGRSLNRGCEVATGDILVFISGHCVPTDSDWLEKLCAPIRDGQADYVYGRQLGGAESHFSECMIFEKYYPATSCVPQQGFFCNNANSAISRQRWSQLRFDEELTGLEDMELAKRLCDLGGRIAYVAEAGVHHYHHEQWRQVQRRFEREALALQKIMPQIQITPWDMLRYIIRSVLHDWAHARREKRPMKLIADIVRYRVAQYVGSYTGNHEHRRLSNSEKDSYFYPSNRLEHQNEASKIQDRRVATDEGKQRASAR